MKAIEFETELHGGEQLSIPLHVASQLPESGRAKVILLMEEDAEDATWRQAAHERFMSEDASEDSVYDKYDQIRLVTSVPG